MGWNQQSLREQAGFDQLLRLRGSVDLPDGVDSRTALDGIQIALMDQSKRIVLRTEEEIRFGLSALGRLLPGFSWNALGMFHAGRFQCAEQDGRISVTYDLTCFEALISVAVLSLAAAAIWAWLVSSPLGLVVGPLAFASLYGMNVWIARERIPGFLQRASRFSEGRPIPDPAALAIDE